MLSEPYSTNRQVIDEALERHRAGSGGRPAWYRQPAPLWTWDTCPEFERLFTAAGRAGVHSIACLALAAHVLSERRGCTLLEAWDRIAHNLERYTPRQGFTYQGD